MMRFFVVAASFIATAQSASVLMVLTSHDNLGEGKLGDDPKKQTGWYLPEAAHPYAVFSEAGIKMTWASPKGGKAPVDESSVAAYTKGKTPDPESIAFLKNEAWQHTVELEKVNADEFDAVFVVGGFGVMYDLVKNEDLQHIAAHIFEKGGVVSAVCHGPAALVGVKLADGSSLVKGKKVSCFSNAEEDQLKKYDDETCEDAFVKAGAEYTKGKPWSDKVSVSGRLITGQNPMSAKTTAQAVVTALGQDASDDEDASDDDASVSGGSSDDDSGEEPSDDDDDDLSEPEEKSEVASPINTPDHQNSSMSALLGLCGCVLLVGLAAVGLRTFRDRQRVLQDEVEDEGFDGLE